MDKKISESEYMFEYNQRIRKLNDLKSKKSVVSRLERIEKTKKLMRPEYYDKYLTLPSRLAQSGSQTLVGVFTPQQNGSPDLPHVQSYANIGGGANAQHTIFAHPNMSYQVSKGVGVNQGAAKGQLSSTKNLHANASSSVGASAVFNNSLSAETAPKAQNKAEKKPFFDAHAGDALHTDGVDQGRSPAARRTQNRSFAPATTKNRGAPSGTLASRYTRAANASQSPTAGNKWQDMPSSAGRFNAQGLENDDQMFRTKVSSLLRPDLKLQETRQIQKSLAKFAPSRSDLNQIVHHNMPFNYERKQGVTLPWSDRMYEEEEHDLDKELAQAWEKAHNYRKKITHSKKAEKHQPFYFQRQRPTAIQALEKANVLNKRDQEGEDKDVGGKGKQ